MKLLLARNSRPGQIVQQAPYILLAYLIAKIRHPVSVEIKIALLKWRSPGACAQTQNK